jgi:Tfp pilus assembly protein PilO
MKEAVNLFQPKERQRLFLLAALIGIVALFYFFGAANVKRAYRKSIVRLDEITKSISAAEESRAQKAAEWDDWQQAYRDMEDLKENYFYSGQDWMKKIRIDLQRILEQSRIRHTHKTYQYAHFEKERMSKGTVEFSVTGSYNQLKDFIHSVERFPRFLMIERIDFVDIDPQGLGIKLKILLAGYHADF